MLILSLTTCIRHLLLLIVIKRFVHLAKLTCVVNKAADARALSVVVLILITEGRVTKRLHNIKSLAELERHL